ncbi:jg12717 [Pararge aegeria aegeria]|uniref:Jg12717 protein n=1 Tax=Pararge aegeria aegeria TaxID=348720 RepID=A0A8S4RXT2_9NEOP|nr:jg12717 [Pararge aegeria aegeria]
MVCDGGAMLCLESLMTRWRERGERGERRARSRSLCSSAAEGSLLQLLHRRASSAIQNRGQPLVLNINRKSLVERSHVALIVDSGSAARADPI